MWRETRRQRAARRRREQTVRELHAVLRNLHRNEAAFQLAEDEFAIERVIYDHAALMCHCRALLRALRGESTCLRP